MSDEQLIELIMILSFLRGLQGNEDLTPSLRTHVKDKADRLDRLINVKEAE